VFLQQLIPTIPVHQVVAWWTAIVIQTQLTQAHPITVITTILVQVTQSVVVIIATALLGTVVVRIKHFKRTLGRVMVVVRPVINMD
jgi:hypothetical protein